MPDFALQRFVDAQERDGTYLAALGELRAGRKRTHWIWFVFPQVGGLGSSPMSRRYAISGAGEAAAYLAHPLLGPRLRECADALLRLESRDAEAVLGPVDAIKVRSSMTLFARVSSADRTFQRVLDEFFGGLADEATLRMLEGPEERSAD